MTTTALHTTTATTATTSNDVLPSSIHGSRQSWACSNCQIAFDNGKAQRKHMKSSWHVYNLKRKIASLPPISLAIFNAQVKLESAPVKTEYREVTAEEEEKEVASPYQCLFCPQKFDDNEEGLESNLDHMSIHHGLFIPDQSMISDLESFLGYLATEVREWHECLYCGTARDSTVAIQSHMRDRGHCKLNLEREPELLDFWDERSDGEDSALARVSNNQLVLSSGKTMTSRVSQQRRAKAMRARGTQLALWAKPDQRASPRPPKEQSCRQLARRDEMGLQSIGPQQRQALVLAVKRSQKQEEVASRASEWSYARKANKQKHDQAHGPLSWAKGGMHNLLPR
ncbi:hypothetical protein BU23DRAFT_522887 [Bimuria novae-zelandiae CBS 107.79]|uniref:C2H2-type domain-containing protein n=1 Tax=Bimuria novae-zelandiae CBS 107.79 TaxID=1447943 RepID=A0A6A5VQP2_9PLEO|nr:hypothetical protein BU23DRAFT_522887 [Bimuria novae-zelandiae CBS 107.79]